MSIVVIGWLAASFASALEPEPQRLTVADGWQRYEVPAAGVSVTFPGAPRRAHRSTATVIGSVVTEISTASWSGGVVSVTVTHLPLIALMFFRDDVLFRRAGESLLAQLGGRAFAAGPLETGPFAYEIRYWATPKSGGPQHLGWARMVLRDDRLVVINGLVARSEALALERFFGQIRLAPPSGV